MSETPSATFSQIDDALYRSKERFVSNSVESLRKKGAPPEEVAMFRNVSESMILSYNLCVLSEFRTLFGMDVNDGKKGGEA